MKKKSEQAFETPCVCVSVLICRETDHWDEAATGLFRNLTQGTFYSLLVTVLEEVLVHVSADCFCKSLYNYFCLCVRLLFFSSKMR